MPVDQRGDDGRAQPAREAPTTSNSSRGQLGAPSSTTDGSSLVKIGVGFSTAAPTVTGRDSQRGVREYSPVITG